MSMTKRVTLYEVKLETLSNTSINIDLEMHQNLLSFTNRYNVKTLYVDDDDCFYTTILFKTTKDVIELVNTFQKDFDINIKFVKERNLEL